MNRALPPRARGCRAGTPGGKQGHSRAVPGAIGLVGGNAATGEPTIGPGWATVGPRSLRQGCYGVSAKTAVPGHGHGIGHISRKSPPRPEPGGPRGRKLMLRIDPVGAPALLRFEGLD